MISQAETVSNLRPPATTVQALVRYGVVPQVARYEVSAEMAAQIRRGLDVVIETDRGTEMGTVLDLLHDSLSDGHVTSGTITRLATDDDIAAAAENEAVAAEAFLEWVERIAEWKLDMQLVDVEFSLDRERTILYVLNDRGAETTRLALLAAANGLGIISVQPVTAEGVTLPESSGGGCGTGGCGCSH